jgi:putative flippase GtrA
MLSYFLNRRYVFSPGWLKNRKKSELTLYIATGILGSLVTGMLFYVTASIGITNILFQKMISAPVSFIVIFLIRNNIIFKL